jgi:hypothetical protein
MEGLTPNDQQEFADPAHIVAHLKLARITGEIISDIYGRSLRQDQAFIYSVQKVLRNLRSWAETLPENVRLISAGPYRYASRNIASLHLCFNQVEFQFFLLPSPFLAPTGELIECYFFSVLFLLHVRYYSLSSSCFFISKAPQPI